MKSVGLKVLNLRALSLRAARVTEIEHLECDFADFYFALFPVEVSGDYFQSHSSCPYWTIYLQGINRITIYINFLQGCDEIYLGVLCSHSVLANIQYYVDCI